MYNTSLLDCTQTEVAVDIGTQTKRIVYSGLSATAISVLLSATALAANNTVIPCEQVSRDLKSLDVPVEKLTVNIVDHMPIDPDATKPISADAEPRVSDFEAPVLLLTPRVTNILRDVFGVSTTTPESKPESSSPVADRDTATETTLVPVDSESEEIAVPLYQRQMYRTDI